MSGCATNAKALPEAFVFETIDRGSPNTSHTISMYACTFAYVHVYICVYVYIRIYVYMCVFTYACTHMYKHMDSGIICYMTLCYNILYYTILYSIVLYSAIYCIILR